MGIPPEGPKDRDHPGDGELMEHRISYRTFDAVISGGYADVTGKLACGEMAKMEVRVEDLSDQMLHYLDIFSNTRWPEMGAHEASDLRVLMRLLAEIGLSLRNGRSNRLDVA